MRIGVDLGGTKIEVAGLGADGDMLLRRRVPSPSHSYTQIVETITGLVKEAEEELGADGTVGVAHPGAISPATGLIKNSNSTVLNGRRLGKDLEASLGRPVRLANDADCFVLSEATDGAGAGLEIVFGVILGTGVGGGIVVRGELVRGPNAITGEWGHNPLPSPRASELPGPACYCGRSGCIETWLSGRGLATAYRDHRDEEIPVPRIVERAAAGEAAARASLDDYVDRLARALSAVINILDPHVVVLGGGLSNIDALYAEVPRRWGSHILSDAVDTQLRRSVHGDSSGVRGAAWLW